MKKLLTPKFILIFAVATFVVVLIAIFQNSAPIAPSVLRTYPAQNATKIPHFDRLQIEFDKVIDLEKISITSEPEEVWTKTAKEANVLILDHKQYFHVETDYAVTILYEGKPIHTLNFKTAPQQSDPRYAQEVVQQMARDYPLATSFPFENSEYTVMYKSPLMLEITPKSTVLTEEDMIREVRDYVKQKGADPETHKYVVAPAATN